MAVFFTLLINLLPLYAIMGAGYVSGKLINVDHRTLASLAMYLFMPIVTFGFVADLDFQISYILLPFIVYGIQTIVALSYLKIGKIVYGTSQANLLSIITAFGNTGYFGLPLVLLLFPKELVAIYIFMNLGTLLFESTIGYYIAARGQFSVKESLLKIARFPVIYAITLGFIFNFLQVELPELFWTYWTHFKGAYVVIGMMIVGTVLSHFDKLVSCNKFLLLVFSGKFIVWPLLMGLFIFLDQTVFHLFENEIHRLMIVISIVPPAANVAAFATQMDIQPAKAATTVLIGTVTALIYIPTMIWLLGVG